MKKPLTVTITGAAGQIGYALAFRVASGQLLGPDQPVNLNLLEITPTLPALQGVVMELDDCAFPLLNKITATDDATVAFRDSNVALLVGWVLLVLGVGLWSVPAAFVVGGALLIGLTLFIALRAGIVGPRSSNNEGA